MDNMVVEEEAGVCVSAYLRSVGEDTSAYLLLCCLEVWGMVEDPPLALMGSTSEAPFSRSVWLEGRVLLPPLIHSR